MIRPIMPSDLQRVVALAEVMHGDSRYKDKNFNRHKLLRTLLHQLQASVLVGYVDEKEDNLVGAVVGFVDTYFFGDDNLLTGYGLYVVKEYRKSKSASKLLSIFVDAAKIIGVDEIQMISAVTDDPDALDPLYKKNGFSKIGSMYSIDLHDKSDAAAA